MVPQQAIAVETKLHYCVGAARRDANSEQQKVDRFFLSVTYGRGGVCAGAVSSRSIAAR